MLRNSSKDSVVLTGENLTIQELVHIARHGARVALSSEALEKVDAARRCIETRLQSGQVFYGINTGFGALSDVQIPLEKTEQLQYNLIRSHACGVGEPLSVDIVRAVLALRIQTMLRGNSGIRREVLELMVEFLNRHITPIVPSKGSVGACGDLAPLAHIALALIGEGQVWYLGKVSDTASVLAAEGLQPIVPAAKEGLCLINGTQVMTAIGMLAAYDAHHILKTADIAAAMTLDALKGSPTAFRADVQAVRPHKGQEMSAENLRTLLTKDEIRESHKDCKKVQDAYSLRCAPQVHGASRNAWLHVCEVLQTEANSSTDNPLVFPETNEIVSAGNFHGEPVAMALDYLGIAIAEIASISERRIEKLVNPHMSGLPPFLAIDSGLNSGFMIPHVVAAALVSENKVLAHPASVDSIPTSAEKEDHVSMGMTAALKLQTILKNTAYVLAIEIIAATEGIEFHYPLKGGRGVMAAVEYVRNFCPSLKTDRSLHHEIERLAHDIISGGFVRHVENALAPDVLL